MEVIKIILNNGKDAKTREARIITDDGECVHVIPCYESWEQFNASRFETLQLTVDYAEKMNGWLHGGREPRFRKEVEIEYSDEF